MSDRRVFFLKTPEIRDRVCEYVRKAPEGYRVEIKEAKRTLDQNAKLWPMLEDIAKQYEHFGRHYTKEMWKCIFLHELGRQAEFVPTLDGGGFIPIGQSSSDLSVSEMRDLIELLYQFGAEHGIVWSEPKDKQLTGEERQ